MLVDGDSLGAQGVTHGQNLLVISLGDPNEVVQKEQELKLLEDVKNDTKLLALDSGYMEVHQHILHW